MIEDLGWEDGDFTILKTKPSLSMEFAEPPMQFDEQPRGILVAAWVPAETAKQLVVDDGESIDDLHITLAYYPNADADLVPFVVEAVTRVAMRSDVLEGVVSGRGRFYGDKGKDVFYASPDIPGLSALREQIYRALDERGIPPTSQHGWSPHITLRYVPEDEPLTFAEIPPIRIEAITVAYGDLHITIPLAGDDDPFDMSEFNEPDDDWMDNQLLRFAAWFGYDITPNPASSLGFRVVSPTGKVLGGKIASQVIAAWQKNPSGTAADKPKKGKGGAKGGGGGKGGADKEAKAAEKAAKKAESDGKKAEAEAHKLEASKQAAAIAIDDINPERMQEQSKGRMKAGDIQDNLAETRLAVEAATTPEEVRAALKLMKKSLADYKYEMTKPPPEDSQARDAAKKVKDSLPTAKSLAGTSHDEGKIQAIMDKHVKAMASAASPADVQRITREMRQEISSYKIDASKAKSAESKATAAAKKAAQAQVAASKKAAADALKMSKDILKRKPATQVVTAVEALPRTASEWADYYTDQMLNEPSQFMAVGQPRNKDGEWTKGGGSGASGQIARPTIGNIKAALPDGVKYSSQSVDDAKLMLPRPTKPGTVAIFQHPGTTNYYVIKFKDDATVDLGKVKDSLKESGHWAEPMKRAPNDVITVLKHDSYAAIHYND